MAHGPHRRRVEHVRARLWQRVWVQAGLLELALVYGRLARAAGRQMRVHRRLERAARRAQTEERLLVELDFAVQVLLGEPRKILAFLRVVRVHLGHRRVQDGLASRSDFLVGLRSFRCFRVPG